MFSGFMLNAWEAATIVALVAGVVGFFAKPEALEAQLKKYAAVRV